MKRLIYVVICLLCVSYSAFSQDYYWYKGKQIPLQRGNQYYILYEDHNDKDSATLQIIESGDVSYSKGEKIKWGIVAQATPIKSSYVVYQMHSFLRPDSVKNMFVTHRFYVKLKNMDDIALLLDYSNKYGAEIEQEGDFPLWYIMRCEPNAQYNALELANIFYESGLFDVSEPEFINVVEMNCVNDPNFFLQWNLQNTGTYGPSSNGIDINYCAAHSITTGNPSIIIGVYDNGVELTHPDINVHSFNYDVNSESSPSNLYYNVDYPWHATACAGIIGAKTNNNIGVAGIAPDCPVMSLSFAYTTSAKIIRGFKKAADENCAVICAPWSLDANSFYIDEGISYALSTGRGGKGCVVVFPAGNDNNNYVDYPADYNDSIIVVGAVSPCGQRKNPLSCDGENWWASNYGNKLDVMAPGVIITTTDIVGSDGATTSDYMFSFNGTSAACAHVAAVAGLILSVRPDLTQKEVADILESTAQKVGNYSFSTNTNRPNGTWNNEMGYGLVDAYEAVIAATDGYIQGPDFVCDTTKYYLWKTPASGSTISWSLSNANSSLWNYSIIGPTNQDTVYVKCVYSSPTPLTNNGQVALSDQPSTRNFIPTLSATITKGADTKTYTKQFRAPKGDTPAFTISSSATWYTGTSRTFTVTNCSNEPDSVFSWIAKRGGNITGTGTGKTFTFTPVMMGTYNISVTNNEKECGNATTTHPYSVYRKTRLNATADNDLLYITISEDAEEDTTPRTLAQLNEDSNYTIELWHSIYGLQKEQVVHSASVQINTSNLPQGLYVVVLKENGEIIAQTKVQIY